MRIFKPDINFDFVGRMGFFAVLSTLLVVASIAIIAIRGLNFGIDFAGGYEVQVKFPTAVSEGEIKKILNQRGISDARVQRFGPESDHEYLIMVREHGTIAEEDKATLRAQFETLAGGPDKLKNWSVAQSGESLMVGFESPVKEEQVRSIIETVNLKIKKVTRGEREDRPEFAVELVSLTDQIGTALTEGLALEEGIDLVKRVEFVGPQVGAQLRSQGIWAVLSALGFILLYIAVRFDLFFSPGAIVAVAHDVVITVGVFALLQLEFNLPIVAAILALIGYSLNDTIVVYDRIRENVLRLRGRQLRALVNTSLNQTLSRTVLTSGTTLMVVGALLVVGGGIIRDFSIALAIGVVVGTYSSVAVASSVYILLREGSDKKTGKAGNKAVVAA